MKGLWVFAWILSAAFAGGAPDNKYIRLSPVAPLRVHPGETINGVVKFTVNEGLHVQANPASRANLIPTTLTVPKVEGLEVGEVIYPKGVPFRMKGSDQDIATYAGEVEIRFPLTANPKAKSGRQTLKAKLRYQACEETSCFFPVSVVLDVPVDVVKAK